MNDWERCRETARMLSARGRRYRAVAFELLTIAARHGDAEAIYALATWRLFGRHVEKDPAGAVPGLRKAARLGHAPAMFDLAVSLEKGHGVKRSERAAFKHYLRASELGHPKAMESVARCFYHGIGTAMNRAKYELWAAKAEHAGPTIGRPGRRRRSGRSR